MADIRAYLEIRTAAPSGFSPTGDRWLVSTNLTGTSQVHRQDEPGGDLVRLTDLPEPAFAGWLPTEDRLLVVMDAAGNERHQLFTMSPDAPEPITSVDDLDPLVVDPEAIHRTGGVTRDGRWLAYATNRRNGTDFDVFVRDLGSGDERCVWDRGGWNSPAGFSPDGRHLAIAIATELAGDNEVHLLDLETGESWEMAPHDGPAGVGGPAWLPDGETFLFSTDIDRDVSSLARYDVASRSWAYLDELHDDLDGGLAQRAWSTGAAIDWTGSHLLVTANVDGISRAWLHDPATLAVRRELPLPGDGVVGGYRFSQDGRWLSFSFSSSAIPGDAFRYDTETGVAERLTTSPCDVDPDTFVEPELIRFDSFDGLSVPAFVFRPTDDHTGPRPVVVVIHGGPESQYRPSFAGLTQYLVSQGFAVVAPNVRGSTGYGKRYQHLDDIELRLDSVRDLEGLHDWIAADPGLDEDRAALYGGSYGGYMVLAGLALQPDRWAAGVDVVGISSLVTFLENTSAYRRKVREREYGSLDEHHDVLVEASPITHVDAMRAPLMIIHGANDPRVPLSEAEQIHDVLTAKGVRCELLVYEDEGHGLAKLANRLDAYPQVAAFLREVIGDRPVS